MGMDDFEFAVYQLKFFAFFVVVKSWLSAKMHLVSLIAFLHCAGFKSGDKRASSEKGR
jgi:hypothetical protein